MIHIMKKLVILCLLLTSVLCHAGEPVYVDASAFPLYGKISDDTNERYERLPGYLENVSRTPVWRLGRNSAGLYIRFRAKTENIYFKWTSLFNKTMNHMADTGTKGLDLYALTDEGWRFVRSARPKGKENDFKISCGAVEREYMLYLSLYDGISALQIGVDPDGFIDQPLVQSPSDEKPVIMYGTSILQGGCASRPGMAHTNILARMLDREVINLGFSGNAFLDYEIAELMASCEDPGLFVLDYAPNAKSGQIDEKAEKFFRILRDAHPDVPVVIVEMPIYAHSKFYEPTADVIARRNASQKNLYNKLKKAGEKKIYYIDSKGMIGDDNEATVDGTHFTDLGMLRYAEHVYPILKKAVLKK